MIKNAYKFNKFYKMMTEMGIAYYTTKDGERKQICYRADFIKTFNDTWIEKQLDFIKEQIKLKEQKARAQALASTESTVEEENTTIEPVTDITSTIEDYVTANSVHYPEDELEFEPEELFSDPDTTIWTVPQGDFIPHPYTYAANTFDHFYKNLTMYR